MTIPKILFGVYELPPEKTTSMVERALEAGYRGIDSARLYKNEYECGQGIANFLKAHPEISRKDIYYTSKVAQTEFGYDNVKKAIADSLEKVKGLGYIDLYLLHSSHGGPEVRASSWKALVEAKKQGIVKQIGVSNWGVHHFEQLAQYGFEKPYVNQIEINPWLQRRDIVDYCKKNGILVEAWGPLTRGLRLNDIELVDIAKKFGKSPAQVLIRWAYQYGTIPIVKTANPDRLKENLEALDFELWPADFNELGNPHDYFLSVPKWDPTKLQ